MRLCVYKSAYEAFLVEVGSASRTMMVLVPIAAVVVAVTVISVLLEPSS